MAHQVRAEQPTRDYSVHHEIIEDDSLVPFVLIDVSNDFFKGKLDPSTHQPTLKRPLIEAYDGPGYTNLPGVSNILWTPVDLVLSIGALIKAIAIDDQEAKLDITLRFSGMPFAFLQAILSGITLLFQVIVFFEDKLGALLKPIEAAATVPTLILGIGLCVIEGIYESIGAARAIALLHNLNFKNREEIPDLQACSSPEEAAEKLEKWLHKVEQDPLLSDLTDHDSRLSTILDLLGIDSKNTESLIDDATSILEQVKERYILKDLEYFEKEYLTLSPEATQKIITYVETKFPDLGEEEKNAKIVETTQQMLGAKRASLDRRVRPWCGQKIADELLPLLCKLRSPLTPKNEKEQTNIEAQKLLKTIDIQAKKKLLVHTLAIIAIALTIIGAILTLVAAPYLLPLVLMGMGGAFAMTRYFLINGLQDEEGWNFSVKKCLPNFVIRAFESIRNCLNNGNLTRLDPRQFAIVSMPQRAF
jgi:hypothetical protein